MANRTQLEQVVDGDQLSQGYFNEIGEFYVERTDTGGPYTHNTATFTLKQTFTFSGLSTNYVLTAIEFEDLTISDSSGNSNDTSSLAMKISDGTTDYECQANIARHIPTNVSNATAAIAPVYWNENSSTPNSAIMITQTTLTLDRTSIPVPRNMMTGATSYDVELYLQATQNAANTVTLAAGFTIRLIFKKRIQDLGTSTSQA